MANVWAIKSGDWSDTTVWNTGALPTSADDVYANNFNVNVNQSITVNSLRNTANTNITAGGTFTFNTGDITANISNSIFAYNSAIIAVTASSGNIVINAPNGSFLSNNGSSTIFINHTGSCNLTITAILIKVINGTDVRMINKESSGLLVINANIETSVGYSTFNCVRLNSNSTTIINGNLIGGTTNFNNSRTVVLMNGNLNINGNITGGTGSLNGQGTLTSNSGGMVTITGTVRGNVSRAVYATAGTINIIGNIIGSSLEGIPSVEIQGAAELNHVGTAQASSFSSAIVCNTPTQSIITCTGPFLKNGYIVAIASQTLRINFNSNSYFQFKKSNGDDIDYVSTIEGYNYPATSDVRYGVSYKSGLAIGTCHVPTPDNVRKNIPVDNTVGTSDNVNAEDILEAIQNSSLPIAERLRNVSTVESTGAQLEAYQ